MTSLYIVRNNSTNNEIECNYQILKYIRFVTDCIVEEYTLDCYKQEVGDKDTLCLYMPNLSDEIFNKIQKFITDISMKYNFTNNDTTVFSKS
jgi:hypothetical protein